MSYDAQYYREPKEGLNGWSEGWTVADTYPTEGEALIACADFSRTQTARRLNRDRWRVVDEHGNTLWSVFRTSGHAMIDRGE